MSIVEAVARVACQVAGGNQDITAASLGTLTPKAALFVVTRAIADGVAASHAALSIGAATSPTERWTWGCVSEDGQNPTDTERQGMTDECIFISLANGGVDGEADLVAFIPGGCRINWGNAPAAGFFLTVKFWAGSHLDAFAGTFAASNLINTAVDVNGVGFEPDAALFATGGFAIDSGSSTGSYHSFGVAVNDGSDTQRANIFASRDNVAVSEVYGYFTELYACGQISASGGGAVWTGEIDWIAAGFRCTTRLGNSGGTDTVGYLALKFNGAVSFWAGTVNSPIAIGNQTTAVGFKPQGVTLGLTQLTAAEAYTGTNDAGSLGVSLFDASEAHCNSYQDEDGQTPSDTQSLSDNTAINLPDDDGTAAHVAAFVSFNPTSWTWNFSATEGVAVKFWAFVVGAYIIPTPLATVTTATGKHQSRMLTLVARQPLWVGAGVLDDNLATKVDSIQVIWTALGGYWALRFNLKGNQNQIEDWLENGLGRDITLYSDSLLPIWEGEVSQVSGNIGALSQTRGPLLDTVANKIRVVYSTVDTAVTPPAVGVRAPTAWVTDTASQAKYGIIERVVSIGGANATTAAQIRDTRLLDFAVPKTTETDNLQSTTETNVTVDCLGYVHRLNAYVYNQTTVTGQINASAKLQAILAADPNGIFSVDYSLLTANTTQVGAWENDDRVAWSIVKGITSLGDAAFSRYLFGIYAGRRAEYAAVPTTPKYQRSLSDPGQWLALFGSGGHLRPWDVQPGQWTFYTDLFTGRTQETTLRLDPRYLLIEQGTFDTPWSLALAGGDANRTDQLLAQLGLGGSGA